MISIITSLYNSDKYLGAFLKYAESVSIEFTKKKVKHEFLIISNASNDTEKIILKKLEHNDRLLSRIIFCERESLYATWNRGVREAQYQIITFWNVDDNRFSEAITEGIEEIKNGAEIVYFPFRYKRYVKIFNIPILAKSVVIRPLEFDKDKFSREMHCGPFFMVKKDVFNKIGYFDSSFKIAGDFEWLTRAAKNNIKFTLGKNTAGIFTNDGTGLSGSKNKLQAEENNRIIK